MFAPCCLQVEGGSRPLASELWFVSMSALISALGVAFFGFGLADMDGMATTLIPPRPSTERVR